MKIVLSALLVLLIVGCSDEKQEIQEEVKPTPAVALDKKVVETKKSEEKIKVKETVKVKKVSVEIPEKIEKSTPVKVQKKSEKNIIDGAKIFTKCSSCHGKNAEKKALNKSQIIQGWNKKQLTTAINGYKDGSYGSSMKGVMKPQVMKLTNEEVAAVAAYISKL